jgi:peptidoglycan/LPS O-acetylase OafA/YrhL
MDAEWSRVSEFLLAKTPRALAQASASRLPLVDFMRGVAALLIVAHHLAFYGPLSDLAYPLAPAALDWLYDYARMAVQAFLVIGGFVTARRLARLPALGATGFASELWSRYRRVGVPYLAALVLAIACNELARHWMDHPSISAPPTPAQLLAHAAFLTQILGYEPLTAGVWYLAIDFQLLVVSLLLLAASQRLSLWLGGQERSASERIFAGICCAVATASLLWASHRSELDMWAVYFFCTYFLGMLVEWVLRGVLPRWTVVAYSALVALALVHEFRPRLLVALGTAVLLFLAAGEGKLSRWPRNRASLALGKVSYSLFLVHFPVCLVVNAWGSRHLSGTPHAALFGMLLAFALSILAAFVFYRTIERRCLERGRSASSA